MWMPEYLQNEGNKLLKLVEEPPPNTIFIFVAENESLILPTILSRTQLIKIPLLQNNDIDEALQSKEKTDAVVAHQISSMSEGNYREALQQLQHADDNWEVLLRDWLNTIIKTGPAAQVKWIEEVSKLGREKQKQFLKYFMHLLEYAIRIRTLGAVNPNETNDYSEGQQTSIDFSSRFNKLCDISQQEAIIKELDTATYHIERNANAKILFHALTIRLYHIISNKSVILVS
jgi:DNA polymerase-3 subunit delta'